MVERERAARRTRGAPALPGVGVGLTAPEVAVARPAPVALAGRVAAARPRVLVLGDAVLDGWVSGPAHRTGRDGPVPVVEQAVCDSAPGGAGNTAAALAALGADVELVAPLGDDDDGRALRRALGAAGVRTDRCVLDPARCTPAKRRVLAGDPPGQQVARFDTTPAPMSPATTRALADQVAHALRGPLDAVLVADYGLGALTEPVRRRVARARTRIPLLVVDAHDPAPWAAVHPDALTPSASEAAGLLGCPAPVRDRIAWAARHQADLVAAAGGAEVLLTLDVDGAVRLPPTGPPLRTPAGVPAPATLACGAGDVFAAAWTAAVAAGVDRVEALPFAQAAADVAVARPGTAVCPTGALAARLAALDPGRVLGHRDLLAVLDEHRAAGHRIVFTNGCFDVLHRGHVAYLRQARALGEVLVVALNSDASVTRLKGPARPVNPLPDRAGVVGALSAVDLVTAFEADSPVELLELVRPDVYAKGGDYTPEMLPETPVVEALGGEVRILDYLADHSTSAIVARARAGAP
jgi:rfaE bifunctional protein nucleotidyltransferase chain/domain/rfaE bifunctional protein kinase chain/domain